MADPRLESLSKLLFFRKGYTNENVAIFILCIGIATMFWLLTVLSKPYTDTVELPVSYSNLPTDSILINPLPDELSLTVEAPGWDLALRQLRLTSKPLKVDVARVKGHGYLVVDNDNGLLKSLFSKNVNVLSIRPDTIRFDFDARMEKKVPIRLNADIQFQKQFYYSQDPVITPDSVLIRGPRSKVDVFEYWSTQKLERKDVNHTFSEEVALAVPHTDAIQLSHHTTQLKIPVEQITEGKLEIPIRVIEPNQANTSVILFKKNVAVSYKVGLSKYDRVNASRFEAVADFTKIDLQSKQVNIDITMKPPFLISLDHYPKSVEFIVYHGSSGD